MSPLRFTGPLALALIAAPAAAQEQPPALAQIRAMMPRLQKELEALRGLRFKAEVELRYQTNAAFLLVSVLTLGIYVPQTVEWWCCAPEEFDNEDELLLEAPAIR